MRRGEKEKDLVRIVCWGRETECLHFGMSEKLGQISETQCNHVFLFAAYAFLISTVQQVDTLTRKAF